MSEEVDEESDLLGGQSRSREDSDDAFLHVRDSSAAHDLMHSSVYLMFNVAMLAATLGLMVWVLLDENHYPDHWMFVVLEVVLTLAIAVEVLVEVGYQGATQFCTPRRGEDGALDWPVLLWNWFQATVAIACVAALPFILSGPSADERVDSYVSLALLLGRYGLYLLFIVVIQYRSISRRGGLHGIGSKAARPDWDVMATGSS